MTRVEPRLALISGHRVCRGFYRTYRIASQFRQYTIKSGFVNSVKKLSKAYVLVMQKGEILLLVASGW